MGKVLKIAAIAVGVAVAFIPGVGTAISGALAAALSGTAIGAGATFAAVSAAGAITAGLATIGVVGALGYAAKALGLGPKPPKQSPAGVDRLRATLDPRAYRKIVFGHTAGATDVHYQEFTGSAQEYLNSIVTVASHAVHEIAEIWFDEKKAWSAAGGVTSDFSGYLTVDVAEDGGTAYTISGSTSWTTSTAPMTGLAYVLLRYKLTGNSKTAESPFASGITSRITIRTKGAKLYDPRRDSTVTGGSGTHRAATQSTWAWVSDDVGRNPALQLLWYLLGWRIQNPVTSAWKLACGLGLPAERIDIESFIAAANHCDESVALAAGGTEPRYRSDGVFSEGDAPSLVFENLLAAMNGVLRDAGGKLALEVLHNDLATPVVDLTEDDVIGDFAWVQTPPIDQSFNAVRGRYVDASDASLYQMVDYPDVTIDSPDDIDRSKGFDLPTVQSASQAQRLAKQFLQRAQYPGTFTADFLANAWNCQVGSVVALTFPALGFSEKLFRVVEHTIRFDGTCPMTLREENAAIYAWDADESAPVTAAAAIGYDPLNDPFVQAIGEVDEFTAASNDRNTTTPGQPGAIGSVAISKTFDSGNVSVAGTFTFAPSDDPTDANSVDFFEYLTWSADTAAAHTLGTDDGETTNLVPIDGTGPSWTVTFLDDVAANKFYTIGVRAVRKVHPDLGGWKRGPIRQYGPFQPLTVQDHTGQVGGTDAADVADATDLFNGELNSNGLTPDAVTAVAISSVQHKDGTAEKTIDWAFTPSAALSNKNAVSGYKVGLRQSSSGSGYSYNPADDAAIWWTWVRDPAVTELRLVGPVETYDTAIVFAWRDVRSDIDADKVILSAAAQSSSTVPHHAADSPAFDGTLDGTTTANIALWAGFANDAINSDGTLKDNTVGADAILNGAINAAEWESQGATIALGTSDGFASTDVVTILSTGTRAVAQLLLDYEIEASDPTHDEQFSATVEIWAHEVSSGDDVYSAVYTVTEKWNPPTTTGNKTFGRKRAAFQWAFDGDSTALDAGLWDIGYRLTTSSNTGMVCRPYRYMRAEDKRAGE